MFYSFPFTVGWYRKLDRAHHPAFPDKQVVAQIFVLAKDHVCHIPAPAFIVLGVPKLVCAIAFLVAGLSIGLIVGPDRLTPTDPLFVGLFSGALTLFLIELGAIAANRLRDFNGAGIHVVVLGIVVPLINGSIGAVLGSAAGMSVGGVAVMATLAASASYIAAPAAIRIALPEASPGIYVTASLGITFPFNLIVGIPMYIKIAEYLG